MLCPGSFLGGTGGVELVLQALIAKCMIDHQSALESSEPWPSSSVKMLIAYGVEAIEDLQP